MPKHAQNKGKSVFYLDSCIFINYLNVASRSKANILNRENHESAIGILKYGEEKKCEIVTSTFTQAEVCRVTGQNLNEQQQEAKIKALFALPWIREINFERKVAEVSRIITRRASIQPKDSIHMATALRHGVDFFVSTDSDFLNNKDTFIETLKKDFPVIEKMVITNWPEEVNVQKSII